MKFTPFDLEYIQSKWEQVVEFNLTESGVHPISLADIIRFDDIRLSRRFLCFFGRIINV